MRSRWVAVTTVGCVLVGCGGAPSDLDASVSDASTTVPPDQRDRAFDFDGDGLGDLLLGDPERAGEAGGIWIVRGRRSGVLAPELLIEGEPLSRTGEYVFRVGDRDGDARYEVGTVSRALGASRYHGRWYGSAGGSGALTDLSTVEVELAGAYSIVSAEIDGDDAPDLVVRTRSCRGCDQAFVITGAGSSEIDAYRFAVLDTDGDARRELVAVTPLGTIGMSAHGVDTVLAVEVGPVRELRAAGDVNGDGREDLFVVGDEQTALVQWRAGGLAVTTLARDRRPLGMDLDCDGFDDLYAGALVFRGGPDEPIASSIVPTYSRTGVAAPDLDGDGCRERVGATTSTTGAFTGAVEAWTPLPSDQVRLVGRPAVPPTWRRPRNPFVAAGALWDPSEPGVTRLDAGTLVGPGDPRSDGDLADGTHWYGYLRLDSRTDRTGLWERFGDGWRVASFAAPFLPLGGDVDGDAVEDFAEELAAGFRIRGGPGIDASVVAEIDGLRVSVSRAGDVDGDGRIDVLASYAPAGLAQTGLWLAADLAAGLSTPRVLIDAAPVIAADDVDDDGIDDLLVQEGSDVLLFRGRAVEGPDATPLRVMVAPELTVQRRGLALASSDPVDSRAQVVRLTTDGTALFGAPIDVPLSVAGAIWLPVRGDFPLLFLPRARADGGMLVRFDDAGGQASAVVTTPLEGRPLSVAGID